MVVTKPEFDKAMKEINEFAVQMNKRLDALEAVKEAPAPKTATKAK
tara:strand:- start:1231 stop:1368 length:138 start_codon:yes stop_codon:yes gene_type:complete